MSGWLCTLPVGRSVDTDTLRRQIEVKRRGWMWGQRVGFITPRLLDKVFGDGRRLMAVFPLMLRPRHIVVRVDSSTNSLVDEDKNGECVIDAIYAAAEEQWPRCYCARCRPDEEEPDATCAGFPRSIDWSDGSSWADIDWPDLRAEHEARLRYKRAHLLPWRASGRIGRALIGALALATTTTARAAGED